MLEEIVKIAADFASRTGFQAYLEPPDVGAIRGAKTY
jgi:hypothetical protein